MDLKLDPGTLDDESAELRLYRLLGAQDSASAYRRYNAMRRRCERFRRALQQASKQAR